MKHMKVICRQLLPEVRQCSYLYTENVDLPMDSPLASGTTFGSAFNYNNETSIRTLWSSFFSTVECFFRLFDFVSTPVSTPVSTQFHFFAIGLFRVNSVDTFLCLIGSCKPFASDRPQSRV